MKRVVAGSVAVVAAACTGSAPVASELAAPDWRGPAVHCRHLGDGGLEVELVAPTAGHRFELRTVQPAAANGVEVVLQHTLPTGDLVAQVVTPLRIAVPAERLGDAAWVAVRIQPPGVAAVTQLAIATARPRRGP